MSEFSSASKLTDRAVAHLRSLIDDAPLAHDRYTIHEIVGRGGMGAVYRAHDELLQRDVAIKVLDERAPMSFKTTQRLKREATILARLEHPGIVPVHDAGELGDGRAFYVMQLVRGVRLDEYARGGISRGDVLRLILRVCEIVGFANAQGVVHRDLKPSNIMIGPFGEVLVLDWGVAKVLNEVDGLSTNSNSAAVSKNIEETKDGMVVGTHGYMSPEQASGASGDVTQTADVYSLGVILRELLSKVRENADKALSAIAERATSLEPRDRYGATIALAAEIRRWLDGEPVVAYHESALEQVMRVYRRHQTAIWLVGSYVALRVTVFFWRRI
ncbi:MAG: serine/threonine-protein kinase [Gemmatimonadaceae bacterium]